MSYWIYMYCGLNCIDDNDFIELVIRNENNDVIKTITHFYKGDVFTNQGWRQEKIQFSNQAKNSKHKANMSKIGVF